MPTGDPYQLEIIALTARVKELEKENAYLKKWGEGLLRQVQTINPLAR